MIHPTALIAPGAELGSRVRIGAFCTVGPKVTLGDGVELLSHVVVDGRTRIGPDTKIYPFTTIGLAPQDLKYKGEDTETVIGSACTIRENCTIHRGTVTGSGVTRIGNGCLLMAVVHVAHDCDLGNNVIVANNVVMGGHVAIADRAFIGGSAAIHQFVRIGTGAMVGGMSGIEGDVIPFGSVIGNRARLAGLNIVGLKRAGLDKPGLHRIRLAFNTLFRDDSIVFANRIERVRSLAEADPYVAAMLRFVTTPSKRGLIRTMTHHFSDDAEG